MLKHVPLGDTCVLAGLSTQGTSEFGGVSENNTVSNKWSRTSSPEKLDMATWDQIDVDFGGDETVNFGPREESGTALYQVDTVATISAVGEVTRNPVLSAAVLDEDLCVAAGNHVSLFKQSGHQFVVTLTFGSDIDCICWSDNAAFFLVAENSGAVHFIHAQSQKYLLSQALTTPVDTSGSKTFQLVQFTPSCKMSCSDLVIVSSSGQMYTFLYMHLDGIDKALSTGDVKTAKTYQNQIKSCHSSLISNNTPSITSAAVLNSRHLKILVTAGDSGDVLSVWHVQGDTTSPISQLNTTYPEHLRLVSCKLSHNGRFLFALDDEHTLSVWDTRTLIKLSHWEGAMVNSFMLQEIGGKVDRLEDIKLVLLTCGKDGQCCLQLLELPGYRVTYSLQLSHHTVLAESPVNQEGLFVLEGVVEEGHNLISSIRVRCLTESQPETRLYRILHKGRFDEAEQFAMLFNLDVELVYKVKASRYLDQISPWNASRCSMKEIKDMVVQLKQCLLSIGDDNHVTDCCVKACLPTFHDTLDLLNYIRKRLEKNMSAKLTTSDENVSRQVLLTRVLDTLHRLSTFQVCFGVDKYSGAKWDRFLKVNLLNEMVLCLKNGDVSSAFSIWNRHQCQFEDFFKLPAIEAILSSISEQVSSATLKPWLSHDFIPYVIRVLPTGLECVAKWLEERAKGLEILEKAGWPENGLSLAQVLQDCFASCSQNIGDRGLSTPAQFVAKTQNSKTGAFGQLQFLVASLKDLLCLHRRYNCKLSLTQYLKETTESITYRMLDRVVALELIPQVIRDDIKPYMKEHGLMEDKMLFQYVQDVLQRAGRTRSYASTWEAKAITVIKCIRDPQYKCEAILKMMTGAFIPWSNQMEVLVEEGLSLDHPRVSDIKEQCRVIDLMKMLTKYELKNFVPDAHCAQTLVYYILTQDMEDSMVDALKVVSAYSHLTDIEAYCFRLRQLISKNKMSEVYSLVHSLADQTRRVVAKRIIAHTVVLLNDTVNFDPEATQLEKTLYVRGALIMLRLLLAYPSDPDHEDLQSLHSELRFVQELQQQYGEFITLHSYRCAEFRKNLLRKHVEAFFTGKAGGKDKKGDQMGERKQGSGSATYCRLYRLAEVLQVTSDTLRGQLAVIAATSGEVTTAIKICRELFELAPCPDTAKVIYKVVHSVCSLYTNEDNLERLHLVQRLPQLLLELANNAVTICSPDLLGDCLELCKCVSLLADVSSQCESGDYDHAVQSSGDNFDASKVDPYRTWTFDKFFKEDGFVLDSAMALPMICEYTLACLPSSEPKDCPYLQSSLQGLSLQDNKLQESTAKTTQLETLSRSAVENVQFYRENNQCELAFRLTVHTLWTLLAYMTKQNMGAPVDEDLDKLIGVVKESVTKKVTAGHKSLDDLTSVLLMKVFNHRYVDRSYALGLMCRLPKQVAFDRLKKMTASAGLKYKRVMALARLGIDFANLTNEPKVKLMCQGLEITSMWGVRLSELKISFAEAFKGQTDKSFLIADLVQQEAVDIKLLTEYCQAFQLDENKAYLSYVDALLLSPQRGSSVPPSQVEISCRHSRVKEVLTFIPDEDLVIKKLEHVLHQLDPYSYEHLSFVLNELYLLQPTTEYERDIQLLKYLVNLKRSAPPSDFELNYRTVSEEEQILYGGRQVCEMAKIRVPFHPLVKEHAWKIISPELTAENVEVWVLIAQLLKLPSDQIYLTTIQNIIKEHTSRVRHKSNQGSTKDKSQCNWHLDKAVDLAFFDNLRQLLMKVKDCKLSVVCVGWIVKELPMGAEKVLALKACVTLSQRWINSVPDNSSEKKEAMEAYKKYVDIYNRLATEQVLFQHNLGQPELISLANTPAKLVFKLYEHESIPLRFNKQSGLLSSLPDIHKVTDEIASINKIDMSKIRLNLVEQWLPTSNASKLETDADMTLNIDFNINLNTSVSDAQATEDDSNLKRVTYILQCGPLRDNCLFLINFAFKRQSNQMTSSCRVRALQCLFSLADKEIIEDLTKQPIHKIRQQMQIYLYLAELERLHMPHTFTSFDKCNKEGLVRGIWRNHCHEEKAVRLVSDLCLDYDIFDVQLWNSILQQLLAFGLVDYLRHVLVCLSGCPDLWQVTCIQKTWSTVLMTPLSSAVPPVGEEQKLECLQTAKLLHRCPLVLDLDVLQYSGQFSRLEMPSCALSCLLLISDNEKRAEQIQSLFTKRSPVNILDELANFLQKGEDLPSHQQVQDAVYNYVDVNKHYNLLEGTSHFSFFVNYLVREKRIEDLLLHAVKASRLNEASDLVSVYLSCYPDNEVMNLVDPDAEQGVEKLKAYLKVNSLYEGVQEYFPKEIKQEPVDSDQSMNGSSDHSSLSFRY